MTRGSTILALLAAGAATCAALPSMTHPGMPRIAPSQASSLTTPDRAELAPWALTASDGSGLVLARVSARAVVHGPLAFTELELTFHNGEPRVREGTFQIALPPRATVARFAMEIGDRWMEAEVVEKVVARRAYDDFLHRRQDPALLEKTAGNQFTARVFPIAPRADKRLAISYVEQLPGSAYTLPLRGLPTIGQIDVEIAAGTQVRLSEHAWRPDRDLVVPASPSIAVTAGDLVAASIELGGQGDATDPPSGLTLLVDTSASHAGLGRHADQIARLVRDVARRYGDQRVQLVAFDQTTELLYDGRASQLDAAQTRALVARGAAGASDLGQAFDWLAARAVQPRLVVITDGVVTAGAEGSALAARLARVAARRVDVVLVGGLRDEALAELLARARPRPGAVLELDAPDLDAALGSSVATDVPVEVPGATWRYPRILRSARAGTSAIVLARLASPRGKGETVEVVIGGRRHALPTANAPAALLEHEIAAAEIRELEQQLRDASGDAATRLRGEVVRRSVAYRIPSTETAMLVLETEQDYARYGIDRSALPEVLVLEHGALRRRHRDGVATLASGARGGEPSSSAPRLRGETPSAGSAPETAGSEPAAAGSEPAATDADRDRFPDAVDRCPNEPETFNGLEDDDGCPDRGRVVVTDAGVEVLDPIYFASGTSDIPVASHPILDAIAATLTGNPEIVRLEVQGHADVRGDVRGNLALSERRARVVRDYLISRGVAASRLVARAYGASQAIASGPREGARAHDRRVSFLVIERAPAGVRGGGGARAAEQARTPAGVRGDGGARAAEQARTPDGVRGGGRARSAEQERAPALTGELARIEGKLARRELASALAQARAWHAREPGDVLALIGLGDALEAHGATREAARVYGSIIDLFPGRADLRRFAGERLGRVAPGRELAVDTLTRAVADRPDHLSGHRLRAYALVRVGRHADAFAAILAGLDGTYRGRVLEQSLRLLREDAAMIGTVYASAVPSMATEIVAELARRGLAAATRPSTRFVLYWETDSNDVDLHVIDGRGDEASYAHPSLPSGGELYADITSGFGPECFAIAGTPAEGPYRLAVHYFRRGPMGYGMGLLQIQRFHPARGLSFEDRPYVIMNDQAVAELGSVR